LNRNQQVSTKGDVPEDGASLSKRAQNGGDSPNDGASPALSRLHSFYTPYTILLHLLKLLSNSSTDGDVPEDGASLSKRAQNGGDSPNDGASPAL
jgi:hypothetical protein